LTDLATRPSRVTPDAARVNRWGWWYFAEYQIKGFRAFAGTIVATALGNPVLYLAAMGIGLGGMITQQVGGVDYVIFVAPALLVSTVVTTASGLGMWPIMSGFKWEKYYFSAGATPLTPGQIVDGQTVAVGARLLAQGLVFWLVGLAFGAFPDAWSWLVVPIATLAGLAFFAPLMAYSATLEDEGLQFNIVGRFIVMPMFLFAGTFFPLESMPSYLRWIGWISPIWHGTELSRAVSFGQDLSIARIGLHSGFLVTLLVGGLALSHRNFAKRLIS